MSIDLSQIAEIVREVFGLKLFIVVLIVVTVVVVLRTDLDVVVGSLGMVM